MKSGCCLPQRHPRSRPEVKYSACICGSDVPPIHSLELNRGFCAVALPCLSCLLARLHHNQNFSGSKQFGKIRCSGQISSLRVSLALPDLGEP